MQAVQTQFFDAPGYLYEGQLADYSSLALAKDVRSYVLEGANHTFGRVVVEGTPITPTDPVLTPYTALAIQADSEVADLIGVLVLGPNSVTSAGGFAIPAPGATDGVSSGMGAVAEFGSGAIVGAWAPVAITHGQPVYVVLATGRFTNAAGAGAIGPVPGATWYGAAAANSVGRIKL